jgi:hypothetical protein
MNTIMFAFPVLFIFFAAFYGYISISILFRKKPVVMNSKWLNLLIAVGLLPSIVTNLIRIDITNSNTLYFLIIPIMFVILLVFYFFIIKGYTFYGINDNDFRTSLLQSLVKLNIKYTETMNKIKLDEIGTEINISFQEWMGTGMIRIKNKKTDILKNIVSEIRIYISENNLSPKKVTAIFFLIFSVLFLLVSIFFAFLAFQINL